MAINDRHNGGPIGNATLTDTSSVCVAADPYRHYLLLRNLSSSATIYLALNVDAEVNKGITIKPLEWYEITEGVSYRGVVNGICDTGETALVAYQIGR